MIKKKLGLLSAGLVLALSSTTAMAADFEWKFFTIYGVADAQTQWIRDFATEVGEATDGKLNITVFTGGELPYKGVDVYRALSRRQIEMGHSPTGFIAADLPILNAMSMPFVCSSLPKFFEGVLPRIRAPFDEAMSGQFGVTPVIHWAMPGQELWSSKDISSLEDFDGMKIRTWNQGQVATLDKLGATSVSITTAEVTPSLQRGVIDGAITAAINAAAWQWSDVIDNGYLFDITLSHEVIAVNTEALDELPEDVRATFLEVAQKWEGQFRDAVLELNAGALDKLKEQGVSLKQPSPEDAAKLSSMMEDFSAAWAAENGELAGVLLADIREGCQ